MSDIGVYSQNNMGTSDCLMGGFIMFIRPSFLSLFFLSLQSKEDARKAIKEFNGKTFMGKQLEVNLSEDNRRLFVGNVDWRWTKEDMKEFLNPFLRNLRGLIEIDLRENDVPDSKNKYV